VCLRVFQTLIFLFLVGYAIISALTEQAVWLVRLVITSAGAVVLAVIWTRLFLTYYVQFMTVILCAIAVLRSVLITGDGVLGMGLFAIVVFMVMRARFAHAAIICTLDVVVYTLWMMAGGSGGLDLSPWQVSQNVLLHLLVCVFGGYVCWTHERSLRRDFLLQKDHELEQEHTQSILNNMLPAYINKQIKKQLAAREADIKQLSSQLNRPSATSLLASASGGAQLPASLLAAPNSDVSLQALRRTLSSSTCCLSPISPDATCLTAPILVCSESHGHVSRSSQPQSLVRARHSDRQRRKECVDPVLRHNGFQPVRGHPPAGSSGVHSGRHL
jgi:hypothetical protein